MWIDLTRSINEDLKGYDGDPLTKIMQKKSVSEDGYSLYQLSMGMHSGTHIDTPRHMLDEGLMVDELPLDALIGPAIIIDASKVETVFDTHEGVENIERNTMVLVYGGESPTVIDESFARLLIRKNVKVLGIDFASPDEPPFAIHKLLFSKGILLVENLTNLDLLLLKKKIELVIAPVKIHTDGAIARVYANVMEVKE